jgi:hypothetical protein
MNKWRLRNRPDRGGPIADQDPDDGGSVNSELSGAAESVYDTAMHSVAAQHRETVKKKDAAAKARRKKGRG